MNIKNRLKRLFKLRFFVVYPFGALALFFLNPTEFYFRLGLPIIIVGLLIRIWANGYAVKMDKLTTCGPYAYLRHPLYLGTMLLITGFVVLTQLSIAGVVSAIIIAATYYRTIMKEEKMLLDKFNREYLDYKKAVPAIIPTVFAYRFGEKWPFSLKRLADSKEHKPVLWVFVLLAVFYLKEELITEGGVMNAKMWWVVAASIFLASVDLTTEIICHRRKRQKAV